MKGFKFYDSFSLFSFHLQVVIVVCFTCRGEKVTPNLEASCETKLHKKKLIELIDQRISRLFGFGFCFRFCNLYLALIRIDFQKILTGK